MEDLPFCGQEHDFFQNYVDFFLSMICDKKKVYFFQIHFAHKSNSNRMLAVLLEANASLHTRVRQNVSLLIFPKNYHLWKQNLSVQENRKIKKKINLRIEKVTTPQISTLIAFQEKNSRGRKFWISKSWFQSWFSAKLKIFVFFCFFEKRKWVSKKITKPCPCKKGFMKKNEGKFLYAESLEALTQKSVAL